MQSRDQNILSRKLEYIKGVGPARADLLRSELGTATVRDLLEVFPFRYEDRSTFTLIKDAVAGDHVQLIGQLVSLQKVKGKSRSRLTGLFKDASGLIELTWFQGAKWIQESLKVDQQYVLNGKVKVYKGKKSIAHPEMETPSQSSARSSYIPRYPSTEKLSTRGVTMKVRRTIIAHIFSELRSSDLPETLPSSIVQRLQLCSRYDAYRWIHMPDSSEQLSRANDRLRFEELFFTQLRILYAKKQRERLLKGHLFDAVGDRFMRFYNEKLAFELTNAQKRVLREIRADVGRGIQMNRLLQGDVGSGKTVVALMAMLLAIDNEYQACLLAPTEILAQQHFTSISDMVRGIGVQVAFLSGSVKGKTRKELLHYLHAGHIDILIGTHAILEDPVQFQSLGLAVIDEQHRFGVEQRSRLWMKGSEVPPHVLVMTATPIPRTLAMTTYGDLDVSIIDELPPGRKPVHTVHQVDAHRSTVVHFMKDEIAKGRQIYVVYPLIEESASIDLRDLQAGYEMLLAQFPRPDYQIAIVHGRMKAQDKDLEMQRFASGRAHIMVATTVIEVGVNVPNASIMIIENAERFGLSQLHQLRGRVGRGADQSYCILMTKSQLSHTAKKRIETMCNTNDGFKIAEVDMELRGHGDIEGTMQSGVKDFKIADITTDTHILDSARAYAVHLLSIDPDLSKVEHQSTRKRLEKIAQLEKNWGRIS